MIFRSKSRPGQKPPQDIFGIHGSSCVKSLKVRVSPVPILSGKWSSEGPVFRIFLTKKSCQNASCCCSIWVFPKMVVPNNHGFSYSTKNDHFGVFWGHHHLRKHPYLKIYLPICPKCVSFVEFADLFNTWRTCLPNPPHFA